MHRLFKAAVPCGLIAAACAWLPAAALAQSTFTHVHLRVPDTAAAADWYHELLGGEIRAGGPGPSVRFANGFIGTMANDGAAPASRGGVIDHFGIGVTDVAAVVRRAEQLGATIDEPPQPGVTAPTVAFIVDPWGTRVELLEDDEYPGMNHVHMFVRDATEVRDWFLEVFGGEFVPERGGDRFHCILYGDLWVHISEAGEVGTAPSRGRALDHMGFRIDSTLAAFEETIEETGHSPYLVRPNPPGPDLMFFEGPGGIHFEIAQSARPAEAAR